MFIILLLLEIYALFDTQRSALAPVYIIHGLKNLEGLTYWLLDLQKNHLLY